MNENDSTGKSTSTRKPRKAAGARKPVSKRPAKKQAAPAASREMRALRTMLDEISEKAARAGSKISELSGQGAKAARMAARSAGAATRKAVQTSVKEWKKLDTPRRLEFVATLLAALAATSGAIARGRRKK
jgi:hypothetical protein